MFWHIFACEIMLASLLCFDQSDGASQMRGAQLTLLAAGYDHKNPAYIGPEAYFRVSRKNRKVQPTLNALIPFKVDLPPVNVSYVCLEKVDNTWKKSIFRGSTDFCTIVASKVPLFRVFWDHSSFPHECPVKKGNYTITDFKFDPEGIKLLPLLPSKRSEWRTHCAFATPGAKIMSFWFDMKATD